MQQLYHPLCIEEVVMDTSLLYESVLGIGDQIIHVGCKSVRKNFHDDLSNIINQAYRSVVAQSCGFL